MVVGGDTLGALATRYKTTVEELATLNNIAAPKYLLTIGQVLSLPES